jgi:hypothetical protein
VGIDFLFVCNSLYRSEEFFNCGILEYESLDTGSDKRQDILFRFGGTKFADDGMFSDRLRGCFPSPWCARMPGVSSC